MYLNSHSFHSWFLPLPSSSEMPFSSRNQVSSIYLHSVLVFGFFACFPYLTLHPPAFVGYCGKGSSKSTRLPVATLLSTCDSHSLCFTAHFQPSLPNPRILPGWGQVEGIPGSVGR